MIREIDGKGIMNMAQVDYKIVEKGKLQLTIRGRLDCETTAGLWRETVNKVAKIKPRFLEVQADQIDYCDGSGIGLLLELKGKQQENKGEMQITGLKPDFRQLMAILDPGALPEKAKKAPKIRYPEKLGRSFSVGLSKSRSQVTFLGELFSKTLKTFFRPSSIRWKEIFVLVEKNGADAVGLACLLGFILGAILAFQSVEPMSRFGAEIYVAAVVTIALSRQVGPLMGALVINSRSGSAFAAELGTMKVNEELDALKTMGLDPVRYLVIPRVTAAIFVVPIISLIHNVLGFIGGAFVMVSIGFSPAIVYDEMASSIHFMDILAGLIKSTVFGALIGIISCLSGLQTGAGAKAVGDSATRAVVIGIVSIVIADASFSIIYYFLEI
ncbi:MAG: ABC transporter permease [Planctomycetota bacterium]|jgi:phospholipid/cholesterol/gamma-HCH transport system permease protein